MKARWNEEDRWEVLQLDGGRQLDVNADREDGSFIGISDGPGQVFLADIHLTAPQMLDLAEALIGFARAELERKGYL